MASSLTSPHLLSFIIFVIFTTLTSAEIRFLGETHEFRCSSATAIADPIFQHYPVGATAPVNLFAGVGPRPGTDVARFTAELDETSGTKTFVYTITNIHGKDGGEYNCDYGKPWNGMKLTVIHADLECPDSLDAVKAKEAMKAECTLQKMGPDTIEIKWKWHGDILLNSANTAEVNKAISTLNETAIPGFNNAILQCFMDLEGVTPCNVTGNVEYPPQSVTLTPTSQKLLKGKQANVTCSAEDANPAKIDIAFKVKKGAEDWTDADASNVIDGNTLQLTVDEDYHVMCEASNGIDPITSSTENAWIHMIVPASIEGDLTQAPLPANAGKTVNITCPAEPDLAQISWTKNGEPLPAEYLQQSSRVISFVPTPDDDGAVVACNARVEDPDVDDPGQSARLTLSVNWSARVKGEAVPSNDGNGTEILTEIVSGNPTPNVTVIILNNGTAEKSALPSDSKVTEVIVTIKAKEKDLPISYEIIANGESIKQAVFEAKTKPTENPDAGLEEKASNAGTIAGIIIAVILICVCATLLVVMWKKNLLCPKKGSLDVEKGTMASSDGGLSKPVELEEVEPQVHEPVEESHNSAPLLDNDDDIKKPPVLENGQTEIIPTNSPSESFDDQPPAAPGTPPPPPPPPLASPE